MASLPDCLAHEWLCHSNFSFLSAAAHPEEYVERAVKLGYQGLGFCDFDGVYGIVRAHKALREAKSQNAAGQLDKIFYGAEIHLHPDHHLPIVLRDTLVLYALNLTGYQNLCRIISISHTHGKTCARIDIPTLLKANLQHIVCLIPMRGLIRREPMAKVQNRWGLLKQAFGDRLYGVVSRHLNPSEDCWIQPTLALAKHFGIHLLFSQDCFFHDRQNKPLCDLLQAIRVNRKIQDAVSFLFVNDERHLNDLTAFNACYQSIPGYAKAVRAGHDLSSMFCFDLKELRYQYPKEMIPEGHTAQSFLKSLVWQRAGELFGHPVPDDLAQLVQKELDLVKKLEFADYFLTVWDIVRWARKQGILCQGRGSAANSSVCFLLGITAVDPRKFDLLFERFISAERGDPPDIDVDFEHERREEVIQYIYNHYGRGRAAMVANVITFRSRGAIRAAGKALGIPETMLENASKLQNIRSHRQGHTLPATSAPDLSLDLWSAMAKRLKGYPRHMGIHSGGFVLTEKSIDALVPQEPATMPGRTVVQWAKDDLEELGFFKIDILALGMLSAIRKAISLLSTHHQINLSLAEIPQDDPKTYAMIQKADTVGTFQIESRAQMSMLPRLKPRCFYDLVIEVGIIRPGPIQGGLIHPFLRRRRGEEPVCYAHPKLEPILKRTLGVPIFQEQVMRVAMAVGGFSPGQADSLRKQIGSWSLNKDLGPLIVQLEKGMQQHGISQYFIDQTLGHLKGFADYGFPESHAVSFALISYASCWLKCHYPDAFFVSLLNSQPMGFYSRHALIQAAMRDGVEIRPICVNRSQWQSCLEAVTGKTKPTYSIRLGFDMVRSFRASAGQALIQQRESHGHWHDVASFLKTCPLYRGDLTALAASTALADLGLERRAALWLAEAAPYAPGIEEDLVQNFAKEDTMTRIERDFEAAGTSLEAHPCAVIKNEYWSYPLKPKALQVSSQIAHQPNNLILHTFGMVLVRQAPHTAKGMVFFTLEDEEGFINLAFTPQVYQRYHDVIHSQTFLLTEGHLQKSEGGHSILVKKVISPKPPQAEIIKLPHEAEAPNLLSGKALTKIRNYM